MMAERKTFQPAILRTRELCALLGVHENTLYARIRRGDVPPFRRAKTSGRPRYEWLRADVERWLGTTLEEAHPWNPTPSGRIRRLSASSSTSSRR